MHSKKLLIYYELRPIYKTLRLGQQISFFRAHSGAPCRMMVKRTFLHFLEIVVVNRGVARGVRAAPGGTC